MTFFSSFVIGAVDFASGFAALPTDVAMRLSPERNTTPWWCMKTIFGARSDPPLTRP